MNMKKMAAFAAVLVLGAVATMNADARTQYRKVIEKIESPTPAEAEVQKAIADNKCFACHVDGEKKKVRSEYGEKLQQAFGEGYEFDKKAWKKNKETKQYPADMIKKLRDAIEKAAG